MLPRVQSSFHSDLVFPGIFLYFSQQVELTNARDIFLDMADDSGHDLLTLTLRHSLYCGYA